LPCSFANVAEVVAAATASDFLPKSFKILAL